MKYDFIQHAEEQRNKAIKAILIEIDVLQN
jgi:hypothetical protein